MNTICKSMAVAAVALATSFAANAETPAAPAGGAKSQAPIPTLHCDFKAMSAFPTGTAKRALRWQASRSP
jgi:hypothetical protein